MNRKQVRKAVAATLQAFGLQLYALGRGVEPNPPAYATFDSSGSAFTQPQAINPDGVIAGYYYDTAFTAHGFVRSLNGTITEFDPPGCVNNILANGITSDGTIAGSYVDSGFVAHGFLRSPQGVFTEFDAPASRSPSDKFATDRHRNMHLYSHDSLEAFDPLTP
jgi:hypothetical protein